MSKPVVARYCHRCDRELPRAAIRCVWCLAPVCPFEPEGVIPPAGAAKRRPAGAAPPAEAAGRRREAP